jgi:acyl-CoA dehydrogenase
VGRHQRPDDHVVADDLPEVAVDKAAVLEPDGRQRSVFAMTEPDAGSDVGSIATHAKLDGADYVLDGRKVFISNAGIADYYIVFATGDPARGKEGLTCFVVYAGIDGMRFVRPQVLSAPHPLGELEFKGCRVPVANRLGPEGAGYRLGMGTLDRLRCTVAAAIPMLWNRLR